MIYQFFLHNKYSIILTIITIFVSLMSLFIGVYELNLLNLLNNDLTILLSLRVPRLLAILFSGASLSCAGLIMQSLCRNKFVSPSTGATISSAQLGLLVALIIFPNASLLFRSFFAFIFALLGTLCFVYLILKLQLKDIILVPIVGIMLSNIIGAICSYLSFSFDLQQAVSTILVGHFSTIVQGNYELVFIALPLIILTFIYANAFNLVAMGKNFSVNLGVNYNLFLLLGLSISSMLCASVVSIVGAISYVGLVVPNIVSIIKGDNLKNTLYDTAMLGALFVLLCDIFARLIIYPYELPIDLIVGIVGSIIFIALIIAKLSYKKHSAKRSLSSQEALKQNLNCVCKS